MPVHSNAATGNSNARQVIQTPEAVASGARVAPAPPGQLPYSYGKCGVTRKDGKVCTNKVNPGNTVCLGHLRYNGPRS